MIRFACPQCHKGFQVEDKAAGKKTKCPKCGAALSVPAPERSAMPDPIPQLPAVKPATTAATGDGYALAPEPATHKTDDFWDSLDPPPSEHLAPVPGRLLPMRSQITWSAQRSRAKKPSMALLAVGGLFLIGITVGVTLWATGSFSRAPASKSPEADEKRDDANAERLAESKRREAAKAAQLQKQAEEDRHKREEYERTERERRPSGIEVSKLSLTKQTRKEILLRRSTTPWFSRKMRLCGRPHGGPSIQWTQFGPGFPKMSSMVLNRT
jgi:hypothetical protein